MMVMDDGLEDGNWMEVKGKLDFLQVSLNKS